MCLQGKAVNDTPQFVAICDKLSAVARSFVSDRALQLTEVFVNFYSESHGSKAAAIPKHADGTAVSVVLAVENITRMRVAVN